MVFVVSEGKHEFFTREGDNLRAEITITLKEALLGFSKELLHLDGHTFRVERDEVTQPGHVVMFENEGMPKHEKSGEYGNLFVKINVLIPNVLTEKQIKSKFQILYVLI